MIVGTAGHIDHGKTALVKALTGVDGDRLREEKARGITIDLGFAYLPIAGGRPIGFIDVPGHERFVHTMLAGASGIDFVLLAVAADDGIMPQTLEHLAILDLLGIRRGLVVVTKADLATPERLEEIAVRVRAATVGTVMEHAEILPVSALTGDGIVALRERLVIAASDTMDRGAAAGFRLAVDRVFTLSGIGVVVTGTVLSGSVRPGDRVLISPSGLQARVRSLHAQNAPAESGRAGDRCALNLTGSEISKDHIRRGDMVLDPELHAPTDRIDAHMRLLPAETKAVGQWFPVRLHHAAAEVGARIVLLRDAAIQPGDEADVQLVLDRPIAAAALDRYVIRDVSAQRTIGGGRFVDLRPPARRRRAPSRQAQRDALAIDDPQAALTAVLAAPPFVWDLSVFARDRALSAEQGTRLAEALGLVTLEYRAATIAMLPDRWRDFVIDVERVLTEYHAAYPDVQGIGRERLRVMLLPVLPAAVFVVALHRVSQDGRVLLDGAFVRLAAHTARLTPADEVAWTAMVPLLGGEVRFRPPRVRDIARVTGRPEGDVRRLLKLAGRMGWADEVAHDHFFLRVTLREMVGIVLALTEAVPGGRFTAAQFRDRVANGRKVAIQILEFFDRHGVTVNREELRRIDPRRLDLFGQPMLSSATRSSPDGGESSLVGRSDFKSEWGSQTVPGGFDSRSPPPLSR